MILIIANYDVIRLHREKVLRHIFFHPVNKFRHYYVTWHNFSITQIFPPAAAHSNAGSRAQLLNYLLLLRC